MADSKENYVPVDKGVLRSTGTVRGPELRGGTIAVTLGYGGPAAPYAVRQHEDLTLKHTVGQAKYLEVPARQASVGMEDRLAQRIKQDVKRALRGVR